MLIIPTAHKVSGHQNYFAGYYKIDGRHTVFYRPAAPGVRDLSRERVKPLALAPEPLARSERTPRRPVRSLRTVPVSRTARVIS